MITIRLAEIFPLLADGENKGGETMIIQPENDEELEEINYLKSAMIDFLKLNIALEKDKYIDEVRVKEISKDIEFLRAEIGTKFARLFNPELWDEFMNIFLDSQN